ncbi:MAG: a-glycosyltransferase-related protein glycosyltransferase family 4 protein [Chitinophagaceae bacterium]|nr:a-glycosyltransferase-related protein glycosyltransferase family 4 protein [Chitinophagaceae bacterium]
MKKKRILVSVTTDLFTDQRVHKVCNSLHNHGYDVFVVGRKLKNSLALTPRAYKTKRFVLWFEKGPLFYAAYNIRLFFFLLFCKADILLANDLDTLLPNYLVSKLRGIPLAYDNHEYFTGMPELLKRPRVQKIWKTIEKNIFPKLTYIYTDNHAKQKLFEEEYHVPVKVVKNVPVYNPIVSKEDLTIQFPAGKKILMYQGIGINIHRGTEELTEAMQYLDDSYILYFVGSGDVLDVLKEKVKELRLEDKIVFTGKVPFQELQQYTRHAHLGFTLDKPISDNYIYSLPNKLFDYVHAGVPVIAARLQEVEKMILKYNIGTFVPSHDPKDIANTIRNAFDTPGKLEEWKANLPIAAREVNWQNEEKVLLSIYSDISVYLDAKR